MNSTYGMSDRSGDAGAKPKATRAASLVNGATLNLLMHVLIEFAEGSVDAGVHNREAGSVPPASTSSCPFAAKNGVTAAMSRLVDSIGDHV